MVCIYGACGWFQRSDDMCLAAFVVKRGPHGRPSWGRKEPRCIRIFSGRQHRVDTIGPADGGQTLGVLGLDWGGGFQARKAAGGALVRLLGHVVLGIEHGVDADGAAIADRRRGWCHGKAERRERHGRIWWRLSWAPVWWMHWRIRLDRGHLGG
jgi:hypothetical protein